MAERIKNFFKKKKSDAKFKLAGPGHKLTESTSSFDRPPSKKQPTEKRTDLSEEARKAAAAALARIESKQKQDRHFNTSFAAIQAQVKRELQAERKSDSERKTENVSPASRTKDVIDSHVLAVQGVYFKCPMVGPEILSKDEWRLKIKEFLYEQLEFDRGLTSVLMIYSLNKSKEKIKQCVDTLTKYLENIIKNPDEEKYQRIRLSNRIFTDKVSTIDGAFEFLQAAGFTHSKIDNEEFLVFSLDRVENLDYLQTLCDALETAEPIPLELDRNLHVLSPSQAVQRTEIPPSFYAITPEELKREQQLRSEIAEQSLQLRTKAMREKDEQREMKKYRFALIRIRFPDGIILQGTFGVYEKVRDVVEFVRENVEYEDMPFVLSTTIGQVLDDVEMSLLDAHLVPATILTFQWDPEVLQELGGQVTYLKPEVQMLVQSI